MLALFGPASGGRSISTFSVTTPSTRTARPPKTGLRHGARTCDLIMSRQGSIRTWRCRCVSGRHSMTLIATASKRYGPKSQLPFRLASAGPAGSCKGDGRRRYFIGHPSLDIGGSKIRQHGPDQPVHRPSRARHHKRLMCEIGQMSDLAPPFLLAGGALTPLKATPGGTYDFSNLWAGQRATLSRDTPRNGCGQSDVLA